MLRTKLVDAPRFVFRSGTDSVFAFRVRFERVRLSGESLNRIEVDYRKHLIENWSGAVPEIFIYGDSPDSDTRSKGTLILGIASSSIEDGTVGLSAGYVTEVVECRTRASGRAALREAALARLDAAFNIMVRSTYSTDVEFPFVAEAEPS